MYDCLHSFFVRNNNAIPSSQWDKTVFKSGKSVYEVIRVIDGVPLFFEDHYVRFYQSARLSGLEELPTYSEIENRLYYLVLKNGIKAGNILFVFHYPFNRNETYFMACFIPHTYPEARDYELGVSLVLYQAERENPHAKLLNSGLRDSIQQKIKSDFAYEALLVDKEGFITEGSKSNFFAIRNNIVFTAPSKDVLLGITRKYVFEICIKENIIIREEKVHVNQLQQYEACFITGTSPKILPVSSIGKIKFRNPHEVARKIQCEYDLIIEKYTFARIK